MRTCSESAVRSRCSPDCAGARAANRRSLQPWAGLCALGRP